MHSEYTNCINMRKKQKSFKKVFYRLDIEFLDIYRLVRISKYYTSNSLHMLGYLSRGYYLLREAKTVSFAEQIMSIRANIRTYNPSIIFARARLV